MRIDVIGHSALFIDADGPQVLVDPWLLGSVGWRSWWLDPPEPRLDPRWLGPDYLALTHHHPDHFHYPSMRRIDRRAHVLVPRFGVDVMPRELHELGFSDVTELPHGRVVTLTPEVRVGSFQYGFDDSVFVLAVGDVVMVDVNDAKIRGRSLDQMLETFGEPTFMFKTHSWAQAYPHCYESEDPADLALLSRDTYVYDFLDAARAMRPRYAVPVGSSVAFLHPESQHLNRHLITPHEVVAAFGADPSLEGVELVVMGPGDSWDSRDGFDVDPTDRYAGRVERLEADARTVAPKIAEQDEIERAHPLRWEEFARYFGEFLDALPPGVARAMLPRPIAFEVPSATDEPFWIVDPRAGAVRRAASPPEDCNEIVHVSEGVLADAIEKRIVHFIHGSIRLRVELARGGASEDLAFWGLMMVFEIGYLPVQRSLRPRTLATAWRRRREFWDALLALRGKGSVLERVSTGFATPDEQRASPDDAARRAS